MDRNQLDADIAAYLHRDDLTGTTTDGFVDRAYAQLNAVCRLIGMETIADLTVTDGLAAMPADWLETRAVLWTSDRGDVTELVSVGQAELGMWADGTYPGYYATTGSVLQVAPPEAAEVTLHYFAAVPVAVDDETDLYLTRYPDMLLQACLEQGFRWEQNPKEADARGSWQLQAQLANKESIRTRMGSRPRGVRPSRPVRVARAL